MKKTMIFVLVLTILVGCSAKEDTNETVYQVVLWDETADYTSAPLYLATTKAPNVINQKRGALLGTYSPPIATFTTTSAPKDTKENANDVFLLLDLYDQQIINVYTLHRKLEGHSKSKSLIDPLVSLAKKTSEESPMYLVYDGKFQYAIIGNTAYFISSWGRESAPQTISGIDPGQKAIQTIKIDLAQEKEQ